MKRGLFILFFVFNLLWNVSTALAGLGCGVEGDDCCGGPVNSACVDGSVCWDGTCQCGKSQFPCCHKSTACTDASTTCVPTTTYPNGECQACGFKGGFCCDHGGCNAGLGCSEDNTCQCGQEFLPCCPGDSCPGGGACINGNCTPCGTVNGPCCWGDVPCPNPATRCGGPPDACRPCGGRDQLCCDPATGAACGIYLDCDPTRGEVGTCSCGHKGEQCCDGTTCSEGTCDAFKHCECGGLGQRCCANNSCDNGTCSNGTCTCGGEGQACCPGQTCNGDLTCDGYGCVTCGGPDRPCCAGNTCSDGATCVDGTCKCGGPGQPCCPDDPACTSGNTCVAGTCSACGGMQQPCCDGDKRCNDSSLACAKYDYDTSFGNEFCVPCGYDQAPCCADDFLKCTGPNMVCQNNACHFCGSDGEPCCDDFQACSDPTSLCRGDGICGKCGDATAPCCDGTTCSSSGSFIGNECIGGTCSPCGYPGQRCCTDSHLPQCAATSCVDGQCVCGGLNETCCPTQGGFAFTCDDGLGCNFSNLECQPPTPTPTPKATPTATSTRPPTAVASPTPSRTNGAASTPNSPTPNPTDSGGNVATPTASVGSSTPPATTDATAAATQSPQPTSTPCSAQAVPFQCYRSSVITNHPLTTKVTLADAYTVGAQTLQARLGTADGLCVAATIDSTGSSTPRFLQTYSLFFHQLASRLRLARLLPRTEQVTNQFGTMRLTLRALQQLMVATDAQTTRLPQLPTSQDNFTCYKVQRAPGQNRMPRSAMVVDTFGSGSVRIGEPTLLCRPAEVGSASRSMTCGPDSLLCYHTRRLSGPSQLGRIFTSNQVATGSHYIPSLGDVCLPTSVD